MSDAKATLIIEVTVHCPLCDNPMDLLNEGDTGGRMMNDGGDVMNQVCPIDGRHWVDAHKDFEIEDALCGECGHEFDVKGLEW